MKTPQQKLFEEHMELLKKTFSGPSQNMIWAQTIVSLQVDPRRLTESSIFIVRSLLEGKEIRHIVDEY
jgi:hypothetical protein